MLPASVIIFPVVSFGKPLLASIARIIDGIVIGDWSMDDRHQGLVVRVVGPGIVVFTAIIATRL